ncbi:MAG TPA: hypothetical protein ENH10_00400 [Bacteroidetes bacterium]|nr:tetratricopeptide repeat protein [bacterium BMS3Bbin04]HDO64481.1 hypothetical protein [Bacteroidota bacterium]HEX03606.1 hypothetical protein [Bacteroidota bacterium]
MTDNTTLNNDLAELLARLQPDGFVLDARNGKPDLLSSLHCLPTLGERGRMEEAKRVTQAVLDARDEEGGWDETWTTVIGVEALVALKLRNLPIDGVMNALEFAVSSLRSATPLSPMERELRLARALVLSGMARKDSTLIDAGILRIHGLLDTTSDWSGEISENLHGLLSLVDLLTVSKDANTRELIESKIAETNMANVKAWAHGADECVRARAGIILFKLGRPEPANELLILATITPSARCDTITLKHRIELAVRLGISENSPEEKSIVGEAESVLNNGLNDRSKESLDEEFTPVVSKTGEDSSMKHLSFSDAERSLLLLEELPGFWVDHPDAAPMKSVKKGVLTQLRAEVSNKWNQANRPLVSLILFMEKVDEKIAPFVQSILENTNEIPFEVVACLPGSSNETLERILDEVGALTVQSNEGETRHQVMHRAAKEANAPYLALLRVSDEITPGWLRKAFAEVMDQSREGNSIHLVRTEAFDPEDFMALPSETVAQDHQGGSIADMLVRADTLIKGGDYSDAESELLDMQSSLNGCKHENVTFWTLLGDATFRQNRPKEAYECYCKAVKDDASAERAWIGIGAYHLISEELEEAHSIFNRVTSLNPINSRGHLGLGNTFLKEDKPAEAIPHFKEALRIDSGFRHAVIGLVAAAVQAEKMEDAIQGLTSYLNERPEDVEVRFHLAAIYFGTNEIKLASEHAIKVLKVNPDHSGAQQIMSHLTGSAQTG